MAKYNIQVFEDDCAGCLRCQLACSEAYTKKFNPSKAHIRVVVSGADCSIRFTDECNFCGICADNCFYGALQKAETEDAR